MDIQSKKDYQKFSNSPQQYAENYQSQRNVFARRLIFFHTIDLLRIFRKRLSEIQQQRQRQQNKKRTTLQVTDIPGIKYQDSSIYLAQALHASIQQKIRQKDEIQYTDIWAALFHQKKWHVFQTFLYYLIDVVARLCLSITLYYLFDAVQRGDKDLAYILGVLASVCQFVSFTSRHNGFYQAARMSNHILAAFAFLIYQKISRISFYTVKSAELGKIINMLSNDLNMIQIRIPFLFTFLASFFGIIGVTVISILRLGWTGVVIIIVPLIIFPFQFFVGKIIGSQLKGVNVFKDFRVKVTTEIIEGIKFVKLYGWQIAFKKIIQQYRQKQIASYLKLQAARSLERTIGNVASYWTGCCCLVVTYFVDPEILTIAKIFSILQMVAFLRLQLVFGSMGFGIIFEFAVVLERFANIIGINNKQMIQIDPQTKQPIEKQKQNKEVNQTFEDLKQLHVQRQMQNIKLDNYMQVYQHASKGQVIFRNFNGYFSTQNFQKPTLSNINFHFKKGSVYGIGGKIGSGKSGLLSVILKQVPYYSGIVQISGKISYVQQQPAVFSASIRDNIVFNRQFNKQRYDRAVQISCLQPDLEIFQEGDATLVGQKGMTLSGGQKARVTLARALYEESDIYLFDDPLSAVDSKVAKIIFQETIMKQVRSQDRTVILVTHQIHYLEKCDFVIIMEDGEIKHSGSPQSLLNQINQLKSIEYANEQNKLTLPEVRKLSENNIDLLNMREQHINEILHSEVDALSAIARSDDDRNKIKKEEAVQVTLGSYLKYIFFNKVNFVIFPISLVFFLGSEALNTIYFRFLANYEIEKSSSQQRRFESINMFWGILGMIQLLYFICLLTKYILLNFVILKSNEAIHESMLNGLVRCPASFFDVTPSGQLISKFSNDIGILDNMLSFTLTDTIQGPLVTITMLINIFQINYLFIVIGIVDIILVIVFFFICKKPIVQSRQLDLRNKSPMFTKLNELQTGLVAIRVYDQRISLMQQFSLIVNKVVSANMSFWLLSRAFGYSIVFTTGLSILIGVLLGIHLSTPQNAGLYAISVVYLIQINDYLQVFLRNIVTLQSVIISAQRSFFIADLQSEKQLITDYDSENQINSIYATKNIEQKWPQQPSFKIKNLKMKYNDDLPFVLKGISFNIQAGQKVGIVGRTGAGKSSIIQALLRIYQPSLGSKYEIDKFDALKMGLHSLRKNVSVIPQTPFLFKGTIKQNLDPFGTEQQQTLWKALQDSGLKQHVESLEDKLETNISNVAQTFSVGQKQLLCLARALIRNAKILFLDEATSNVDMKTDDFIQKTLKQKFTNTTIITIAHRLNTIADYDKIIVLSDGKVVQSGSPYELIQDRKLFYEMVINTGKNAEKIKYIACDAQQKRRQKQISSKAMVFDGFKININKYVEKKQQ